MQQRGNTTSVGPQRSQHLKTRDQRVLSLSILFPFDFVALSLSLCVTGLCLCLCSSRSSSFYPRSFVLVLLSGLALFYQCLILPSMFVYCLCCLISRLFSQLSRLDLFVILVLSVFLCLLYLHSSLSLLFIFVCCCKVEIQFAICVLEAAEMSLHRPRFSLQKRCLIYRWL
jgi:hypothetical protein